MTDPTASIPFRRVAILIEEKADLLDIAGPAAVFHCAGRHFIWSGATDSMCYSIDYLSLDGGAILTRQELPVVTTPLRQANPADYDTVIATGSVSCLSDTPGPLLDWLKQCPGSVRRIASVCVGAFTLGRAGLLDGRRATTHWEDSDDLAAQFPLALVEPEAIYTEDRGIWTGAGVSAGIDLALAMVEQDHGHAVALLVARRQVVFLQRPGGQSQFSVQLQHQQEEHLLSPLLRWIAENPTADLRVEALAERAHMSLRSFHRSFVAVVGLPPADWVENARMEVAKRLLEQTDLKLGEVARRSGFASHERMRRTFARRLGIAPSEYRERFARRPEIFGQPVDLSTLTDIYSRGRSAYLVQ